MTMVAKPTPSPPFPFKQLSEIEVDFSITTLVYGDSKAGKTWFAGTAGSRTLYIYFREGEGIVTLKSPLFKEKHPNVDPISVCIEETDEVSAFDAVGDTIDHALDRFPERFDTIVLDEATAFRRRAMWKGLGISKEENRSKTLAKVQNRSDNFFIPAIQDYGMEMNLVEWWVATYTELCKRVGKHLIVCAHSRETFAKLDESKVNSPEVRIKVRPGFTGKTFPDTITAYFDNIWYIERVGKTSVHRIKIYGNEVIQAGTRYAGVFGSVETNPDFLKMAQKIKESGIKPAEFQKTR